MRRVAKAKAQLCSQRAIQLNADKAARLRRKQTGDRAVTRSDFDDGLIPDIAKGIHDLPRSAFVYQEVLPELRFALHGVVLARQRCAGKA